VARPPLSDLRTHADTTERRGCLSTTIGKGVRIMCQETSLLADALIHAAQDFECVAVLIQISSWEDPGPWCLSCPDSEDCWEWNAMHVLTRYDIIEAKRRYRARTRRKLEQNWGNRPMDLIKVMKDGDRTRSAAPRLLCV
jgi:hypothetical protein